MNRPPETGSVHVDDTLARHLCGLLPVLERLLPAGWRIDGASGAPVAARIGTQRQVVPDDVPELVLPAPADGTGIETLQAIRFADSALVPWPFRARTLQLEVRVDAQARETLARHGGVVLATDDDGRPLWTVDAAGAAACHRSALALPEVAEHGDAGVAAAGERFLQILPLVHYLRECAGDRGMQPPPLRASYIIDDPNLHWPTYGYADYRRMAASARAHRYHVAFATIPLDGWWVHPPTAEIFRENPDTLSLLIHGNNHAKHELAQDFSPEQCRALLRQAIRRIEQLESRARLDVCRVMVPPHGACSARMLREMPLQGFESACISAGSLRAHNPGSTWSRSLGFEPSERVEDCPVLPRWAFAGTTETTLLVAAYLGQPLILRGHHQDLKDGLDVLESFAATINALGEVRWGSLSTLSRLGWRHRVDGRTLWVEPLGNRIDVAVPDGIEELRVVPELAHAFAAEVHGRQESLNQRALPVQPGTRLRLARADAAAPAQTSAVRLPTPPRLVLRRFLTETRDRMRVA